MKNKKLRGIGAYSVLAVAIVLVLVVGFNVVKAQSSGDILDQIIQILQLSKEEPVAVEQELGLSNQNGEFIITKKIEYDDISTTGADVTNVVTGDFLVENVVIEMGALTIASGTQIQVVTSGDTYGTSTVVFAVDVDNFPKATTMDLNTAIGSVVGSYSGYASSTQRVVLEDSSKLIIKCTTADCMRTTDGSETGTGYLRVTTTLKKANSYSTTYE